MLGPESVCPCMTSTTEYGRERDWQYAEKTRLQDPFGNYVVQYVLGLQDPQAHLAFQSESVIFCGLLVCGIVQLSFCESGISR